MASESTKTADIAGAVAAKPEAQVSSKSAAPAGSVTPTASDKKTAAASPPGSATADTTPVMSSTSKLGEQLQRAAAAAAAATGSGDAGSTPHAFSTAAPRRLSSAAMHATSSGQRGVAVPSTSAPRQPGGGSKDIAVSWASLEDVAHIAKLMVRWVAERELHAFIDWQQIRATAERIAGDVTLSTTCEEAGLKPEIGQDLAKLALHDIVLVPHRSLAQEADPAAALGAMARSLIRSTTRLLTGSKEGAPQAKGSIYLPAPSFDGSSLASLQPLQNNDVDAAIQAVASADDAADGSGLSDRFSKAVKAASSADASKPVLVLLLLGPGAVLPQEQADKLSKALKEVTNGTSGKGSAILVSPACLGFDPATQPSISSLVSAASGSCSPAATLQIGTSPGAVARNVSALLKSLRSMPARTAGDSLAKERAALEEESSRELAIIIAEEARKQGLRGAGASQDGLDVDEVGSALANAKLSTKKKEALGRVPCKFFRNSANGCSAGAACPFAHTSAGEGQGKQICEWFVKGNCRFGHKCALAHILPGQPMSMDRKNKRAAQHGLPLPAAPTGPSQGAAKPPRGDRQQPQQQPQQVSAQQGSGQSQAQASQLSASQNRDYHMRLLGLAGGPQQRPAQGATTYAAQQRDLDFPFGLPDDLQPPGPAPPSGGNFDAMQYDPSILYAGGLNGSSSRVQQQPQHQALGNDFAGSIGSPPASRAFGTSPFSHPGGHALFFSGSQENGPRHHFGGRSAAMDMSRGAGSGDEEGDLNEEDFLPSSLSDLLTPAELKRRARNGAAPAVAQSMPADRGPSAGTLWELHQRNSRAQQALAEEMLALERLAAEAKLGTSADGRGASLLSPTQPGLDRLRQQLGRASPSELSGLRNGGLGTPVGGQSGGFNNSGAIGSGPFSGSFGDKNAVLHEAGRSLPQGLAAGLSRLHLAPGSGSGRRVEGLGHAGASGMGNGNGSGVGSLGGSAIGGSNQGRISGQWNSDGLDDHLGPTAPSSIFSNRANPLSLAMARSIGGAGSGFPSSIDQLHHQGASGGAGYSLSPHANRRSFGYGSPIGEGISIPAGAMSGSIGSVLGGASTGTGGVASSPGGMGMGKHLGVHRVRGSGNNAASQASPLTLPTTGEEVDEAIFELE